MPPKGRQKINGKGAAGSPRMALRNGTPIGGIRTLQLDSGNWRKWVLFPDPVRDRFLRFAGFRLLGPQARAVSGRIRTRLPKGSREGLGWVSGSPPGWLRSRVGVLLAGVLESPGSLGELFGGSRCAFQESWSALLGLLWSLGGFTHWSHDFLGIFPHMRSQFHSNFLTGPEQFSQNSPTTFSRSFHVFPATFLLCLHKLLTVIFVRAPNRLTVFWQVLFQYFHQFSSLFPSRSHSFLVVFGFSGFVVEVLWRPCLHLLTLICGSLDTLTPRNSKP